MPTAQQIIDAAEKEAEGTTQVTAPRELLTPQTKHDEMSMRDEFAIKILSAMIQGRNLNIIFDSAFATGDPVRQDQLEGHDRFLKNVITSAYRMAEIVIQIRNMTRTELLETGL